jgi:putative membrane protein
VTLPPWHAHVDVWVVLGSVVVAYLLAVRSHDRTAISPTPRRRRVLFLSGMATLWLASDWPIHDLGESYLFAAHMSQHILFQLVAAPLLVAGIPAWMWRDLLRPAPLRAVWRFLTRPVVAIALFNGFLLFYHWPAVIEATVRSEPLHFIVHLLMVFTGLVMWWPIVSPLPEMPPLNPPAQMLYLFIQSIAPTVPASFLTFGSRLLYPIYGTFPRIWGISALDDQMMAGLIMKLIGGFVLWIPIAAIFFRWASREQREGWDELRWRNVDAEIRAELKR